MKELKQNVINSKISLSDRLTFDMENFACCRTENGVTKPLDSYGILRYLPFVRGDHVTIFFPNYVGLTGVNREG
jgi:hypothetical protein